MSCEFAWFIRQVWGGSQNFKIGSHDRDHAHLGGYFVIRTQEGYVFHICSKFEADSSIRLKVIRGSQNFKVGSRNLGHAHLWVILCREARPSSLYQICTWFGLKLWGVPKFTNWVSWPWPCPLRGSFCGSYAGRICLSSLYQIWRGWLRSFKSYKGVPKFQNWVMWPRPRPLRGHFMVLLQ